MDGHGPASPERIDSSFRYGSTIIVGVLSSFSLAFLTAWAANPVAWGPKDLFGILPLIVGVVLELVAVRMLLDPRSLELAFYMRTIRIFTAGLVLVVIGVALAVSVDYVTVSETFRPGVGAGK